MPSHKDINNKIKLQNTLNLKIEKKLVRKCHFEKKANTSNWASWWYSNYAMDIDRELRYKEHQRLKHFRFLFQSPEVNHREYLVNRIKIIAEHEGLLRSSLHLAVYLLDYYMDNHKIAAERLQLVADVCLILACKMEEKEDKIPKITEICGAVQKNFDLREYISLECMILRFYDWNIILPTTAHFMEYFIAEAISEDDLIINKFDKSAESFGDLKCHLEGLIFDYLDLTIGDLSLKRCRPSQVAASCILAARKSIRQIPDWNKTLEIITQYKPSDLEEITENLILRFATAQGRYKSPNGSETSGYITDGSDVEMK